MPRIPSPRRRNSVDATGLVNGNVKLDFFSDGRPLGTFEVSAPSAGGLAATILAAAKAAGDKSGRTARDKVDFNNLPVLRVSTMGISESPKPDHYTFHIQLGEAEIGFEMHTSMLRPLGEALIAASAPKSARN